MNLSCVLSFAVLAWSCAVAAAPAAPANGQAPPAPPPHLTVVTDNNYPPFLYIDSEGRARGYAVDLWKLYERHTGTRVDLKPMVWAQAQQAVLEGRADVIDMIHRTPEREPRYEFSQPWMATPVGIYVDQDIHGITDIASLRGFAVATERGDSCAEKLKGQGVTDVPEYPQYLPLIQAAAQGRVRVFCMDEYPASYYLAREDPGRTFARAFTLHVPQLRRAARKGNAGLLQAVEGGMARITPAEREELARRWLQAPRPGGVDWRLVAWAGGVGGALLALALSWAWALRRSVAARTRELSRAHRRLRDLFDAIPDAVLIKDRAGAYLDGNRRAAEMVGVARPQELRGIDARELLTPAQIGTIAQAEEQAMNEGTPVSFLLTGIARGGGVRHSEVNVVALHEGDGTVVGTLSVVHDITERRRILDELQLAATSFEAQVALMVLDTEGRVRRINAAFTALTGHAQAEALGVCPQALEQPLAPPAFCQPGAHLPMPEGVWREERLIRGADGKGRVIDYAVSAVRDAARQVSHYVCSLTDLTAERKAHAQARHMSFFDALTDLPNRNYLLGQLDRLLQGGDADAGGVLLLFDLDHFKRVNDLRSHMVGDRLLVAIAQRLRACLREQDVVARLGGGMFALMSPCDLCSAPVCAQRAGACARQVEQALREPFEIAGEVPLSVTASLGWTTYLPGATTAADVLREAELAMYEAKAQGRNRTCRYEPAMLAALRQQEELLQELRAAIGPAGTGLALHAQLQVNAAGRATGAEMLLRWRRANGETVPPGEFIPIAEEHGLIHALGQWVLDQTCAQLAAWARQPRTARLSLAANVSARQFAQPGFVDQVRQALARHGTNPARLKLEITESAILGDLEAVAAKLHELRALGIRMSLDDFGTGYSSLSYLSRLPIDQLKIDRSFVMHLPADPTDATVARTVIGMAQGLGLQVVAEGVETAEQRDFLLGEGCDLLQGYLVAPPMPVAQLEQVLAAMDRAPAPSAYA